MTVDEIKNIDLKDLIALGAFDCACGKRHSPGVAKVIIEKGAVKALPTLLEEIGAKKPFLLSGHDTWSAAGEAVCNVLNEAGISYAEGQTIPGPAPGLHRAATGRKAARSSPPMMS